MTAGIAHEVKNPLGSILLYAELLLKSDIPSASKKDIRIIHDEAKRAARVISSLLNYKKEARFQTRRLNCTRIIRKIIDLRRYEQRIHNIRTFDNLPEKPTYIKGDSSQLTRVFMNLMVNAEEALESRNGGNIIINCEADSRWLRITISDNGEGIPEENLGRVFHPFFTTKKMGEGTGLGLSTCYSIVTAHNGLIRAENNADGGAKFTVELPLARHPRSSRKTRQIKTNVTGNNR